MSKPVRLTTAPCRASLSVLTTERSNQHLSVARVPSVRRNTSAGPYGIRGTKGNPVQIRCGRATVIGETLSRRHPFETGCLRKPLSAQCGWEGGEPSLSAMSQEACLRCILAALRGTSEADLPVNRAQLAKSTGCSLTRPVHQVRTGFLPFSREPIHPYRRRKPKFRFTQTGGPEDVGQGCSLVTHRSVLED